MAANAPSPMEPWRHAHHLLPLRADAGERPSVTRISQRHGGGLRRGGEKGCDRRRRALVDVGRPHVERHGRDLEGDTDQQEDEADDKADILRCGGRLGGGGDGGEARRAGEAVDQRAP